MRRGSGCEQLAQSSRTQPRPGRGSDSRPPDRKSDVHHRCTTTPPTSLAVGAFKLTTQRDIRHLKRRLMACRGPHRTRYDSIYGASRRAAVSLFYARTWSVFRRHTDRPLTPGAFHLQDSALPGHLRLLFCKSYLHDTKQTTRYNACSISQCVAKMVVVVVTFFNKTLTTTKQQFGN